MSQGSSTILFFFSRCEFHSINIHFCKVVTELCKKMMDAFNIWIIERIITLHVTLFRIEFHLRRQVLKFRFINNIEKTRYILHTHILQCAFHKLFSSEFTNCIKDQSAARKSVCHSNDHVLDLREARFRGQRCASVKSGRLPEDT